MRQGKIKNNLRFIYILSVCLVIGFGCQAQNITRANFSEILTDLCKTKYQAHVVCKEVDDTIWVYLPYTPGRQGLAGTKQEENNLYLEYEIASFNPYKTREPPELKFVVQRVLGEIRGLLLRCARPYKFFVLVVTDIQDSSNLNEDWYIGYFNDVKDFLVGKDFSGEGYSRLAWHSQPIKTIETPDGEKVSKSYRDASGEHIDYHDITLREFVEKQIKWRIYKKFTVEYNKNPFDLTAQEKQDEVISIVKTVFQAYNFKELGTVFMRDMSFLDEHKQYTGYTLDDLEKYRSQGLERKPAF
jgi:hypothetical protein